MHQSYSIFYVLPSYLVNGNSIILSFPIRAMVKKAVARNISLFVCFTTRIKIYTKYLKTSKLKKKLAVIIDTYFATIIPFQIAL